MYMCWLWIYTKEGLRLIAYCKGKSKYQVVLNELILNHMHAVYVDQNSYFKVSGPGVEAFCVFFCIKNIVNAEMWAWKNDFN